MKAMEIQSTFGIENLKFAERDTADPKPGEVRLRLRAASLNYRDLLTVEGHYNPRQPLPLIPGSDGLGQVEAVGEGVTRVAVGDRVATTFAQNWISGEPDHSKLRSTLGGPLDGVFAERIVLSAEGVVHVPSGLTDEQAACLPCAGLTAWSALQAGRPLRAGDTVLILGTGGVSVFALQFAQAQGARAIVTSSSDDRLERVRKMGAWQTLNYREQPEWAKIVREMTDGNGVDRVIEVGGAETIAQSLSATRFGGIISLIGSLTGLTVPIDLARIFMKRIAIHGILVGHREGFEEMNRALCATSIKPVVDRVYGLEELPDALRAMKSGGHFGKICVRIA